MTEKFFGVVGLILTVDQQIGLCDETWYEARKMKIHDSIPWPENDDRNAFDWEPSWVIFVQWRIEINKCRQKDTNEAITNKHISCFSNFSYICFILPSVAHVPVEVDGPFVFWAHEEIQGTDASVHLGLLLRLLVLGSIWWLLVALWLRWIWLCSRINKWLLHIWTGSSCTLW